MGKFYKRAAFAAVVALLTGGVGAYADDTYTDVYSRTASTWVEADKTEWGGNTNLTIDETLGLGFDTNAASSATKTFSIAENAKVKYEITWRIASSVSYSSNFSYLQIGNLRFSWGNSYKVYLTTDGTSSTEATSIFTGKNNVNYDIPITLIYNTASKTIESLSFNSTDITDKVSGTIAGDFGKVEFGFIRGHSLTWTLPNYLTSFKVSQAEQTVETADYTINYTLDGTAIKTVTSSSTVGATITADKVLTVNDVKYLIVANAAPSITLASGENTLNVPVRKAYTATLNVTYNVGGNESTETTNLIETDDKVATWSYAYPLYKKTEDGTYYKADNTETFGESGTFTDGQVINKTVSYTTADADVVYFADASTTAGTNYSYSNGESGAVAAQNKRDRGLSVGTLAAGAYNFTVNFTALNKRHLVIRHSTDDPLADLTPTKTGEMTALFVLSEETTSLYINGANSGEAKTNRSEDFDYVIVKKAAAPTVTIDATSKLASYSNSQAVTVPTGVVIYKATAQDASTVTLTKVDGLVIPANTGVILYSAEGGEKTLTYGGTTEADFTDNILKATNSSTVTAGDNYYALVAGAQTIAKVESGVSIPENKAYLVYTGSDAKSLRIVFGDATTGIGQVEAGQVQSTGQNAPAYNLAGQRVGKAYKGIVVKNGKKYIVK